MGHVVRQINPGTRTRGIQDINLREGGNAFLEGFFMFKDFKMKG
jgi:hypothetical protein